MTATPDEVDRNYVAFTHQLPEILPEFRGKFALIHHATIVDYFDNALNALTFGFQCYGEGLYSVQEVTDQQDDLGFYSYAGITGQA